MDTGELAIVITLGIGFSAIVIATLAAMFALMWQSRRDTRSLAEDIRDLRNDLGKRVSEAELEQARIEARNELLAKAVSRQENLHQVHAD